jgi:hypothetical protein
MRKFFVEIDEDWIVYQFEPLMSIYSVPFINSQSPLGKWLEDRNIRYELIPVNPWQIYIDVNQQTAAEFVLTWGDIICLN